MEATKAGLKLVKSKAYKKRIAEILTTKGITSIDAALFKAICLLSDEEGKTVATDKELADFVNNNPKYFKEFFAN